MLECHHPCKLSGTTTDTKSARILPKKVIHFIHCLLRHYHILLSLRFCERGIYPIAGMTPSCCIMPRSSLLPQCSTILPLATRKMLMPVMLPLLPLGGIPINSPLKVPDAVKRSTTRSPSTMTSSAVERISGKAPRKTLAHILTPSRPGGSPAGVLCETKFSSTISFTTASRSLSAFHKSAQRAPRFRFCSVDIEKFLSEF